MYVTCWLAVNGRRSEQAGNARVERLSFDLARKEHLPHIQRLERLERLIRADPIESEERMQTIWMFVPIRSKMNMMDYVAFHQTIRKRMKP